ncbi:MAG: SDR family oxidoreductase, partial [Pseudomonadota bacterium]|nr:SDR family oxidoreductase [Pseudomonadota bacterium]
RSVPMPKSFRNQKVLITGGASGIGRQMALTMAKRGAVVVLWDINQDKLDRTVEELNGVGAHPAHGFVCDIASRKDVYEVAAQVQEKVGPVDILINNAGIVSGQSLLEIEDEKIEATFGVNTLALFWTAKAFLPGMVERNHGHIVTIASSAGLVGVSKLTDYCASKWAAVGFDESLRMELRERAPGVKTTVVCPFVIDTGMFEGVKSRFVWLLPILTEHEATEQIIAAIEENRARLIMPKLVGIVPLMRALPVQIFDKTADLLGINVSMNEFVGRSTSARHPA